EAIAVGGDRRYVVRNLRVEPDAALLGLLPQHLDRRCYRFGNRERARANLRATELQIGKGQEIVDQPRQALRMPLDDADELRRPLGVTERPMLQRLGVAADRRERCA